LTVLFILSPIHLTVVCDSGIQAASSSACPLPWHLVIFLSHILGAGNCSYYTIPHSWCPCFSMWWYQGTM
jgi:hypothetical protein